MSKDDAVLSEIRQMYEKIQSSNHYELLGVERESFDAAQLGGIYRNLAKKWHVDRFSQVELGEERAKVQQIFSSITHAHKTLSNPEARTAYDEELDMEDGDGTDVAALLNADSLYLRGKNMLGQGGYKGAYDMFTEAHSLNPNDRGIRIHLLYGEYMLLSKSEEGRALNVKRAQEIFDELEAFHEEMQDTDWLKVFMGVVCEGIGKDKRAHYMYREALMLNPGNREAQRQKRLFELRASKSKPRGFLDKLRDMLNGRK